MKSTSCSKQPNGFALVVTLSLMILLTVIAVGLLTLSSITLRSASQNDALATARANARLALMLALGDLQTSAGPDTRVTATASLTDNPSDSKRHLTGVWESWKIDPNNPPASGEYEQSSKAKRFRQWLVSSSDFESARSADFTSSQFAANERVTLMPEIQAAGSKIPGVFAGLVPVTSKSAKMSGAYAYAVLDEGVKARIDTGYKPVTETKLADLASSMGSGVRADVSRIAGLETIDWKAADLSVPNNQLQKAVSFKTGGLLLDALGGDSGSKYQPLYHDITTSSVGVFADVANGGLKQDLNSILNGSALPADLTGPTNSKLYSQTLGYPISSNGLVGQAEPSWDQIFKFANLYKSAISNKNGGPTIAMQPPTGWATALTPPPATSPTPLMPAVAKMQMYYSLMAVPMWLHSRPSPDLNTNPPKSGNWTEGEAGLVAWQTAAWNKGARYFLMISMMPCITLHNPYNVNLEVNNLSVELSNIPMAIQIKRQIAGGPESGWLPGGGQSVDNIDTESKDRPKDSGRRYLFNLTNAGNPTFTMAPGEVCVFSATAPANATYASNPYRSWNNFTEPSSAQPMILDKGFRGVTIGFYAPRISANELQGYETYPGGIGKRGSTEYLAPADRVKIRIRPCLDSRIKTSATIEANKTRVSLLRTGTGQVLSAMKIDVGTEKEGDLLVGLEKSMNMRDTDGELDWMTTTQFAAANGNEALNTMKSYTFGVVTISSKTTYGKFNDKNLEGSLAAKPMAFHTPVSSYQVADVRKHGLEPYPYEAGVIKLDSATGTGFENYLELDSKGRSYGISGLSSSKGQKFGTIYEVPTGPLQNFTQLNSANVASTNSLARFTYPIGNSWAHPMIPPGEIKKTGAVGTYDHSFLLNSLLFDKYYFAGIGPRAGSFATSASSEDLAKSFFGPADQNRLRDQRLLPYTPDGETDKEALEALSVATKPNKTDPQARYQAASHQLMKGAFNVNSTSKAAWKAMLSSLHASGLQMFRSDVDLVTPTIADLKDPDGSAVRYSRFLVPNNNAPTGPGDRQSVFQGPRDIKDTQLDSLADAIVTQVRQRGPFLSMAEFVNRQLGSSERGQKGALQAAIDATDINDSTTSVLKNTGYQINNVTRYDNPTAMTDGRSDQGAAGYLTQADLLTVLGNAATVRSDTFTIRAYGEARSASGAVLARTWCEAVVQRMPEYISPEDKSHVAVADLVSMANKNFGRRFAIRSFRWITPQEISPAS